MTTASHEDPHWVDRNITRVLKTVMANREISPKELVLKSGIAQSTYFRRKATGGWTATEVAMLARALDVDPSLFYADSDRIVPRTKDGLSPTIGGKGGGSRGRTGAVAAAAA